MTKRFSVLTGGLLLAASFGAQASNTPDQTHLTNTVDKTIHSLMQEYDIPGMAIAVTFRGQHFFYQYGDASKENNTPVTKETIFELGSVSKTFAASLISWAQVTGAISLSDKASQHFQPLAGSAFDNISLLNIATYTAGGLPLQFPDEIDNNSKMVNWYQHWQPKYAPGTHRQYSNPSIGLAGYIAAQRLGKPYSMLVANQILSPLGLHHARFNVPAQEMRNYAWGYSKENKPIRISPGVLDEEAYGLKASAQDMIGFVDANIDPSRISDSKLAQAIRATHTGYYRVGEMTQGLGWELYHWPVTLEQVLSGNSAQIAYQANKTTELSPPEPPTDALFINKTGATNGFGAYVAFVPQEQMGIVLLANKNYPNEARIKAAWQILDALK
ncbi:class C beta-lactamase [Photorhabdus tasmaniensis]|uniref:Beta-lactamase n=1 Tax=Photorhabdus tasmaniensis TaxID=1004159 RepID=A0ABX0GGT0_9GAMM|nr:class C beta-lactamase [Photorhabdus tasmaniensis]NHB88353.1 class C beta-lactamase [Photorhabdus tasmaniensis]